MNTQVSGTEVRFGLGGVVGGAQFNRTCRGSKWQKKVLGCASLSHQFILPLRTTTFGRLFLRNLADTTQRYVSRNGARPRAKEAQEVQV